MLRVKWLLPLIILALAPCAQSATRPYWTNRCASPRSNFNVVSSITCTLSNTVAGRTIIVDASSASTSISITISSESLTCPAGAVGGSAGVSVITKKCYIVPASNHGSLTFTMTAVGGFAQAYFVGAREYVGLGAFDTACASGAGPASSCSLTTANAGEWLDVLGSDDCNDLVPQTGFFQQQYGTANSGTSSQFVRTANWYMITGAAGSYTAQYTITNSLPESSVAALAFQVSSPPALPSVVVVQSCTFAYPDTTRSSIACPLHNYTANDVVVFPFTSHIEVAPMGACSGPNCACPANATVFNVYNPPAPGVSYGTGVCYGFDSVDTAITAWGPQTHFGSGQSLLEMETFELSGVLNSVDVGSEAGAAALTVNYTTISDNEYTVTSCFDNAANPLISTAPAIQSGGANDHDSSFLQTQQTVTTQVTPTAGSGHTTACTETGSSVPLIATLSFGIIASPSSGHRKQAQIF